MLEFVIHEVEEGVWNWKLLTGANREIARGPYEGFDTHDECAASIRMIIDNAKHACVTDEVVIDGGDSEQDQGQP